MFNAPMDDFSTDSVMDTHMLPSLSSDTDWFHAEKMIKDGDIQEQPPEVSRCGHMPEYPSHSESPRQIGAPLEHRTSDTSRATSPSQQRPASQSQALAALSWSDWSPEEPRIMQEPLHEVA